MNHVALDCRLPNSVDDIIVLAVQGSQVVYSLEDGHAGKAGSEVRLSTYVDKDSDGMLGNAKAEIVGVYCVLCEDPGCRQGLARGR